MPTPIPSGLRLGYAEPRDAVAAFERRNLLQPSFRWQDTWQEEHSRAFAVAGVQRLDILQVFREELDTAIREGLSLADVRPRLRARLVQQGWWGNIAITDPATGDQRIARFDNRRLGLIFDVNVRQSQAAGRWERIERNAVQFPFILYRTMRDERVRASHRPWDGLVLPVNHPFWKTHYPPNGWRCRCTAFAVNQRDIERRRAAGETLRTEAPPIDWVTYVNPRTGQVVPVPRGIDPGFAYNPGQERDGAFFDAALGKALQASPLAAAATVAQATADHHRLLTQATVRMRAWLDDVAAGSPGVATTQFAGTVPVGVVRALADRAMPLAGAVVGVQAEEARRALQAGSQAALVRRLPELLAAARAALLERDTRPPVLVLVVQLTGTDGRAEQVAVRLQMARGSGRPTRGLGAMNRVTEVAVTASAPLRDTDRYELLWGALE
jgi:SPP1 gp7 family putative phage head morphogenesis protein